MKRVPLLSVVVPVYNEAATIESILASIASVPIDKEVIVVDDGSTDGTSAQLAAVTGEFPSLRVVRHASNRGKGAALRTGIALAAGQYVVVQDADLEYDPQEYPKLLAPLVEGKADVVFGSRFLGGESHRVLYFWHSLGNRFLTLLSNMFTNLNISDMETCYKVFPREVIQDIALCENRFGIEPELTAKLAAYRLHRGRLRIYEVGISYNGRTYEEGKKIGWRDGLRALWCIVKYNCLAKLAERRRQAERAAQPAVVTGETLRVGVAAQ